LPQKNAGIAKTETALFTGTLYHGLRGLRGWTGKGFFLSVSSASSVVNPVVATKANGRMKILAKNKDFVLQ
jgi:hypothetical protein